MSGTASNQGVTVGYPLVSVDVYTFEGGKYNISQQNVLNCQVTHSAPGGNFTVVLAPGGPSGNTTFFPSWSQVITPMSTVVIAMQRGNNANVVMVGFVENVTETQAWTNSRVVRTITITGADISTYFNRFNWYLFPNIQGNVLSVLAGAAGGTTQASLGVLSGTPSQIAGGWLENLMIGPNGVLGNTYFNYAGQNVLLRDGMQTTIENIPVLDIPYGDNYYSEMLSWGQKFAEILPFPQYEIIYGTAPQGTWDTPAPSGSITYPAKTSFSSLGIPAAVPAIPQFVARVLRIPNISVSTDVAQTTYNFQGADTSLWAALPQFQLQNQGYIASEVTFGTFEYKNYYVTNPIWLNANNGTPDSIQPFSYLFYGLDDPASTHRYGFAPYIFNTRWFADLSNKSNVNSGPDIADAVVRITTRLASYCEPIPLMARGSVTMELRPDIFYGCQFQYAPFRDTVPWQFYISQVTHTYQFGGPSTTTLTLDRGFPASVYADQNLMFNIMMGNASRTDGTYSVGLPKGLSGPALSTFGNTNESQRNLLASIAQAYVTPQYK